MHLPGHTAHIAVGIGHSIAAAMFAHVALNGGEVVALLGFVGTCVSAGAGVIVALLNRRDIKETRAQVGRVKDAAHESAGALRSMTKGE